MTITACVSPREATRAIIDAPSRIGTSGSCARSSAAVTAMGSIASRMPVRRPMGDPTWIAASISQPPACSPSSFARTRSPTTSRTRRPPATRPSARRSSPSARCSSPTPSPASRSAGSPPASPSPTRVTDWTPQPLKDTGEPLDFAINGDGFFAVQTDDGTRYTRNGQFSSDAAGPPDHARRATSSSAATTSRSRSAPTARSIRACSTSCAAQQPREGRQQLRHRHARAPSRARPRARSAPARSRAPAPTPTQSMVDMMASYAGLRVRPEGHPDDRRDARQGRVRPSDR